MISATQQQPSGESSLGVNSADQAQRKYKGHTTRMPEYRHKHPYVPVYKVFHEHWIYADAMPAEEPTTTQNVALWKWKLMMQQQIAPLICRS